jgi:uncharacterized protein (DUF885 family)
MPSNNRAALDNLIERFLAAYNRFYPHNASFILGIHAYDGQVPDFSPESVNGWRNKLVEFGSELKSTIDFEGLDKQAQFDYKIVEAHIEFEKLRHGSLRFFERNPIMPYLYIFDVSNYLKRNYGPLDQRVEALCRHLEAIPALLDQLQEKLDRNLPDSMVAIALEAFGGFAHYYHNDLPVVPGLTDESLTNRLKAAAELAANALDRYVAFFKAMPKSSENNFAIGPDNYRAMLKWGDGVELSLEEVLQVGLADLAENQAAIKAICAQLDPNLPFQKVIEQVSAVHPTNDKVVSTTREYLEGIRDHLKKADLIDLPTEMLCIVAETPAFMRWIFADMETPGPFETVANEAHFYITPANPEWTPAQQENWLSRFNDYTIQIFSMHEAYPGHYLQHLHARRSFSEVARNLTSYAFIEGWAHYCEQMMMEEGYGKENPTEYLKLQLAQRQEALVRDCRYICSIGLHTQGWTQQQAYQFYQDNAWMEDITALKEAQRSTFDPGGLYYTLGKRMFYKLRQDYQAEQGDKFNLREFHNRCLAYGMPQIPFLRGVLLNHDDGKIL